MAYLQNSIHIPLNVPKHEMAETIDNTFSHFSPKTRPNNGTSLYILSHPFASHPIPSSLRPKTPSPPASHNAIPVAETPITTHLTFRDLLLQSIDPKTPPFGPRLLPVSVISVLYPIHHAHPPTTCQTPTPTNAAYHPRISHGALAIPWATNPSPTPELPPSTYTGTTRFTSTWDAKSGSSR
ncbi:hypothetical protein I7I50_08735 [Histoplasma capsulatum G186AR]|uniref:Uncharacterized protein n=1 Tax=Ajellomyces capsulatus TaxID=5037 RepID=A0A8H7YT93_AJECA|nr:hypothetical protein I7I52_06249 [Histoplasma capsulatum]QSS73820.1 hypothetical protein I7I50_08735 [Histoplasma capsulatum G186AR]